MRLFWLLLLTLSFSGCLSGTSPSLNKQIDESHATLGKPTLHYQWSSDEFIGDLALQWIFEGEGICFSQLGMTGTGYISRGPFILIESTEYSHINNNGILHPKIYGQENSTNFWFYENTWSQLHEETFRVKEEATITMAAENLAPGNIKGRNAVFASFFCEGSVSLVQKMAGLDVIRWTPQKPENATGANLFVVDLAESEHISKDFEGDRVEWFISRNTGAISGTISHPDGTYQITEDGSEGRVQANPGFYELDFSKASLVRPDFEMVIYSLSSLESLDEITPDATPKERIQHTSGNNSVIWTTKESDAIGAMWNFSGSGLCFISISAGTPGKYDQEAALGFDRGAGYSFNFETSTYATARHSSSGNTLEPPAIKKYADVTSSQATLKVSNSLSVVLVAPNIVPVPELYGNSAIFAWHCTEGVELHAVEAIRDPIFWSPETRDEDGASLWGAHIHESRATRSYDAPIVELIRENEFIAQETEGKLTIIHPKGVTTFDLNEKLISYEGGPGNYTLELSSQGFEMAGFTLLLDRTPVDRLDDLLTRH